MAHNLARWTARIGLGQQIVTTKTLRRRVFALAGRITRSARRLTLHLPRRWPWEEQFSRALARLRAIPLPGLTAPVPPLTRQPTQRPCKLAPAQSASASCRVLSRHLARHSHCRPPSVPPKAPADRPPTSRLPKFEPGSSRLLTPSPPSAVLMPSIPVHRWIRAKTGLGWTADKLLSPYHEPIFHANRLQHFPQTR